MAKILGAALGNIPWQEKPEGCKYPVWRYDGNPIITRDNLYMANSIFNSAVVPYGDGFASKRTAKAILYYFGLGERPEDFKA